MRAIVMDYKPFDFQHVVPRSQLFTGLTAYTWFVISYKVIRSCLLEINNEVKLPRYLTTEQESSC